MRLLKRLKPSKRGVVFTVDDTIFRVGDEYHYVVDREENTIIILHGGPNKVPRKKSSNGFKPLFDLRSKQVKELLENCRYMEVAVQEDSSIIVTIFKEKTRFSLIQGTRKTANLVAAGQIFVSAEDMAGIRTGTDWYVNGQCDDPVVKRHVDAAYKMCSLFSGCGMGDYPFVKSGDFEIVMANDYNPDAVTSYRYNISSNIMKGDIRHLDFKTLALQGIDFLFGGLSCKPFSNSNRSLRLESHPDFDLIKFFVEIIHTLKPKVWAIENVPSFISCANHVMMNFLCKELSAYHISHKLVCNADVGGYTMRKRVFIVGSIFDEIQFSDVMAVTKRTVRDALSKLSPEWFNFNDHIHHKSETIDRIKQIPPGGNFNSVLESDGRKRFSNSYKRLPLDGSSPTLITWGKEVLLHPTENRGLSIAEAIALSGFSKDFRVYGKGVRSKQQQIANGIPYYMGNYLYRTIKNHFDTYYPLIQIQYV